MCDCAVSKAHSRRPATIMSTRAILRLAAVALASTLAAVNGGNIGTYKYSQVLVNPTSWTATSTFPEKYLFRF